MDTIDVLAGRPSRHPTFSRELLAEAEDRELSAIVRQAASELGAPIALVSLVLEHIQFFKAQFGLPPELAAARATERDVSFCQFVVRDGQPFEVSDAATDTRVPKRLVERYAIRSYLGIPVLVGETVVGSLCVIDTEPRSFTAAERESLSKLAALVTARLSTLSETRHRWNSPAVRATVTPALSELRRQFVPIRNSAASGLLSVAALASFVRLARHVHAGGTTRAETMEAALATAGRALEDCEDALFNIQADLGDAEDCSRALQDVFSEVASTRLSDLAVSGRELARPNLAAIGGASLPVIDDDPDVSAPRPFGVVLVATCLTSIATAMAEHGLSSGIRMAAGDSGSRAEIAMRAPLDAATMRGIADRLDRWAGQDPTVGTSSADGAIRLLFATTRTDAGHVAEADPAT